jgi:hypothetical protein
VPISSRTPSSRLRSRCSSPSTARKRLRHSHPDRTHLVTSRVDTDRAASPAPSAHLERAGPATRACSVVRDRPHDIDSKPTGLAAHGRQGSNPIVGPNRHRDQPARCGLTDPPARQRRQSTTPESGSNFLYRIKRHAAQAPRVGQQALPPAPQNVDFGRFQHPVHRETHMHPDAAVALSDTEQIGDDMPIRSSTAGSSHATAKC